LSEVLLYTTAYCPYCVAAKNFLKSRGANYSEVRVDSDLAARKVMMEATRRSSVPQIFINGAYVGGYEELVALDRAGKLAPMLEVIP
jgi:glutaredoxin 3